MRTAFVNTLLEIAKEDPRIHIVTGDLGFGVLQPFWDQLPNQITNAGIAEQSMTGIATGMALSGKIVFTYSIGNFPTLRCLEQIRNDCAYHEANVKIVCVGGGFVYGSLGMSHHATEDMSVMRDLPNVTVFTPGDVTETIEATRAICYLSGTCYLRLGRGDGKTFYDSISDFKVGKANQYKDGKDIVIFSAGAILDEVVKAVDFLAKSNINPAVYTFPTIKPLDVKTIQRCALGFKHIVTVEENNIVGGFGGAVAEVLAEMPFNKAQLHRIGLRDTYSSIVGSQQYLRHYYGICAENICDLITSL